MVAERKRTLMIAGGVVLLILIVAIVAVLQFDINSYKSKIETAVSEATGLDVTINGGMGLSFFPFGISAKNVNVTNKGDEILSLESLKLGVKLMPLLKKQLEVTDCVLVKPAITIVKDAGGRFNFEDREKKSAKKQPGTAFSLNNLKLSRGAIIYLNKKIGVRAEFKEISLAVRDIFLADTSKDIIKNISFTGSFDCKEALYNNLRIENFKAPVKVDKGVFSFKPLTMDLFGGKGEGDVTIDESGSDSVYGTNVKISKLDFEKLEEYFGAKKLISGKGDFSASLTVNEGGHRSLISSLDGTFALQADNLVTYTMDLDKVFSKYETSQQFDLFDVGAFFIVGPLGPIALRGYRYGDVYYHTQGGKGTITRFVSHWKIKNGEAEAVDCALATRHNRVALKGKLNLMNERFNNVTIAILDEKGCARFKQSVSGTFANPSVGAVSAVESFAGPVFDLYRKAKRIVQAGKCEVFYNGSVRQPR